MIGVAFGRALRPRASPPGKCADPNKTQWFRAQRIRWSRAPRVSRTRNEPCGLRRRERRHMGAGSLIDRCTINSNVPLGRGVGSNGWVVFNDLTLSRSAALTLVSAPGGEAASAATVWSAPARRPPLRRLDVGLDARAETARRKRPIPRYRRRRAADDPAVRFSRKTLSVRSSTYGQPPSLDRLRWPRLRGCSEITERRRRDGATTIGR